MRGVRGLPGSLLKCVCALAIAVFLVRPGGSAEEGKAASGGEPAPEMPAAIEAPEVTGDAGGAALAAQDGATVAATAGDVPEDEVGEAFPAAPRLEPGLIVEVPLVPEGEGSDTVTINVYDGNINDVLNAFSRQTGRNMVIGPNVTNTVTLRLSDTPWEDALEVMLKPYGYGHKMVGETIVINKLDKIQEVEQVEPLSYKVYDLKYLDAFGVIEMIRAQLTERGHVSTITMRGQRGWGFAKGEGEGSGSGTGGKRERLAAIDVSKEREYEEMRSKLIVVADIPSVLLEIDALLKDVDHMPTQVLIEARFVEVSTDTLRDVGVQFGTGPDGASVVAYEGSGSSIQGIGAQSVSGGVLPAAFKGQSTGISGQQPFNTGASFLFQQLTDVEFQVLMHALQEEGGLNVLSAPRILTLNNQEATIMVGEKYPIIRSDVSGQYGGSSTSIDYWQDIGIQLNVVPQICAQEYIRMIVHPAVTEQIGTASGRTVSGSEGGIVPVTDYPILSTREAETQIVIKNGETIVIGGLLKDVEARTEIKVPILGDIPLLGHFFKRQTKRVEQLDLLIFLTATVVDPSRGEVTP